MTGMTACSTGALSTGIGAQVQQPYRLVVGGMLLLSPILQPVVIPTLASAAARQRLSGDRAHRRDGVRGALVVRRRHRPRPPVAA